MIRKRHFASAVLAMILITSPLQADDVDPEFGSKVRQYILENPEIILEAMEVLSEREEEIATKAKLEPFLEPLFETQIDLRMGADEAPKVIVEFFDYNCAACKANMPVMREFVAANPDVAIVKKHLPILSPSSERATRYVLAARNVYGPESYKALHDAIYSKFGPLSMARLGKFADELDLDSAAIEARMQDDDISQIIATHRDMAVSLEVIGTPTFLNNSSILTGTVTLDNLAELAGGA